MEWWFAGGVVVGLAFALMVWTLVRNGNVD